MIIRTHNPRFSRSIIYNVITVGLTGQGSCSPPYVASIKFWLVNDCLFFAWHMESAVYSPSVYSHWLTLQTDVRTVIVLYCCSEPWRISTHWVVFSEWLQFFFLSEDYCKSFFLILLTVIRKKLKWHRGLSWAKCDPVTHLCSAVLFFSLPQSLVSYSTFSVNIRGIHLSICTMFPSINNYSVTQKKNHQIYSIRPEIL